MVNGSQICGWAPPAARTPGGDPPGSPRFNAASAPTVATAPRRIWRRFTDSPRLDFLKASWEGRRRWRRPSQLNSKTRANHLLGGEGPGLTKGLTIDRARDL